MNQLVLATLRLIFARVIFSRKISVNLPSARRNPHEIFFEGFLVLVSVSKRMVQLFKTLNYEQ